MAVQLALHKNDKRIGSRMICWWTGSIYSHCELVVNGYSYSSSIMDGGVRCKKIGPGPDEIGLGANWDVIDLPLADPIAITDYFAETDANKYGWFALIVSQIFNRNQTDEHSQFCSEWCASALGWPNPSSYSPGSLAKFCLYLAGLAPRAEPIA